MTSCPVKLDTSGYVAYVLARIRDSDGDGSQSGESIVRHCHFHIEFEPEVDLVFTFDSYGVEDWWRIVSQIWQTRL